jgi:Transposase DDE domain
MGRAALWDRGDISQAWHALLLGQGLALLTKIRKHMKNHVMRLWDTLLLRKRTRIETSNDQWKNINHIEHTRHRSVTGFMVHLVAG